MADGRVDRESPGLHCVLRTPAMNTGDCSGKASASGEHVVCACLHRTRAEILGAAQGFGLETFEKLAVAMLAGSGCSSCRPDVEVILRELQRLGEPAAPAESIDGDQDAVSVEERTGD
jgi:NAD(P)H-nitrite reductase large subunit